MLRLESKELWVAAVYSVAIGLVSLTLPVAVQAIVNTVAFSQLFQPLAVLTLLVFIALCFVALLSTYRLKVIELMQRRVFVRTAGDTASKLVYVQPEAFDRFHGPELVNRFLDVVTVQKAAGTLLVDGLSVLMQTIAGMILLALYHPWLLAFDVLLVISIALILFPLGSGAISTSISESQAKFALLAWLEEVARHQIGFKTESGGAMAFRRANSLVVDYLTHRARHFRILLRQIVGSFLLQSFASSTLLLVGGWLVIHSQLSLGQLVAAEIVVALVVSGFAKFGKHLEMFYDLMASMDKLGYLTDLPTERESGESLPGVNSPASLQIAGVDLTVPFAGRLAGEIDLTIKPGERIGLVGAAGSGKSSLLDMLYGLRKNSSGSIEIDGHDYRTLRLRELRSQVVLVRGAEIFGGTIFENLRMADEDLTSAAAMDALRRVGLLPVLQRFPEGLEVRLSTGGSPLSNGQAVLLELARALVRKPRLLLLDECLDALDDVAHREQLLDVLLGDGAPWTLLVVTQRQDILARCSRVVELSHDGLEERSLPSPAGASGAVRP